MTSQMHSRRRRTDCQAPSRPDWCGTDRAVSREPLGDVDVLVVDTRRHRVLAVETKDFEQARTPFKLSNELKKLFDGRLRWNHHSERIDRLRDHLDGVLQRLGLEEGAGKWGVEGLIVVSRPLVTPYFTDSPLRVMTVEELGEGGRLAD